MLSDLPPRFFCDFTAPPDGNGITASDEYKEYVHWLADYLHQAELSLSPEQQEWLQQADRSPRGVIFMCSDSYGFEGGDLQFVEHYFAEGEPHDQWRTRMRTEWEDYYPTPLDREITPFEEIRRTNPVGNEFWSSRDFARVLGYADYRNFQAVIESARTACFNSGQRVDDHFVEVTDMIEVGKGARRPATLCRHWRCAYRGN